MHKHPIM